MRDDVRLDMIDKLSKMDKFELIQMESIYNRYRDRPDTKETLILITKERRRRMFG